MAARQAGYKSLWLIDLYLSFVHRHGRNPTPTSSGKQRHSKGRVKNKSRLYAISASRLGMCYFTDSSSVKATDLQALSAAASKPHCTGNKAITNLLKQPTICIQPIQKIHSFPQQWSVTRFCCTVCCTLQ